MEDRLESTFQIDLLMLSYLDSALDFSLSFSLSPDV